MFLVEGDLSWWVSKAGAKPQDSSSARAAAAWQNSECASATTEKLSANQELSDLALALGVRPSKDFKLDDLRYGRIIIMTDADVDGAHIAALLMTYFYREMPQLVEAGRLYLAQPPLYRMTQGGQDIVCA